MTEIPDAAMLMAMVKNAGAGFTHSKWDELLSLVDDQANAIQRVRKVIADMKSNHQSHAEYIKALEQALDN